MTIIAPAAPRSAAVNLNNDRENGKGGMTKGGIKRHQQNIR